MDKNKLFSIGEIRKITNIPHSTLRYYNDKGLVKPTYVDEQTGYRYYSNEDVQTLLILRFYQSIGFNLEEISQVLSRSGLEPLELAFNQKIESANENINKLIAERDSLVAWHSLILEAKMALKSKPEPHIKHFDGIRMYKVKPTLHKDMDFRNLLINHDMTAHLYTKDIITEGALYLKWDDYNCRHNQEQRLPSLMIAIHPYSYKDVETELIGGFDGINCYHLGSYARINDTYNMMMEWTYEHGVMLRGDSLERYVIDPWSTFDEEEFVTEIILPIK